MSGSRGWERGALEARGALAVKPGTGTTGSDIAIDGAIILTCVGLNLWYQGRGLLLCKRNGLRVFWVEGFEEVQAYIKSAQRPLARV